MCELACVIYFNSGVCMPGRMFARSLETMSASVQIARADARLTEECFGRASCTIFHSISTCMLARRANMRQCVATACFLSDLLYACADQSEGKCLQVSSAVCEEDSKLASVAVFATGRCVQAGLRSLLNSGVCMPGRGLFARSLESMSASVQIARADTQTAA